MANEKLIRASEAKAKLKAFHDWFGGPVQLQGGLLARKVIEKCIEEIDKLEPVDAVEVVRCKDCENWREPWLVDQTLGVCQVGRKTLTEPNHFCSYGERKDNA